MALQHTVALLVDQVKAHRKKLVDIEGQGPADDVVLAAIDMLLEIQEKRLEHTLTKLVNAIQARRAAQEQHADLQALEPRGPRRYRKH